jgi:hypothetical protein
VSAWDGATARSFLHCRHPDPPYSQPQSSRGRPRKSSWKAKNDRSDGVRDLRRLRVVPPQGGVARPSRGPGPGAIRRRRCSQPHARAAGQDAVGNLTLENCSSETDPNDPAYYDKGAASTNSQPRREGACRNPKIIPGAAAVPPPASFTRSCGHTPSRSTRRCPPRDEGPSKRTPHPRPIFYVPGTPSPPIRALYTGTAHSLSQARAAKGTPTRRAIRLFGGPFRVTVPWLLPLAK